LLHLQFQSAYQQAPQKKISITDSRNDLSQRPRLHQVDTWLGHYKALIQHPTLLRCITNLWTLL
jgi:hypothetical protein